MPSRRDLGDSSEPVAGAFLWGTSSMCTTCEMKTARTGRSFSRRAFLGCSAAAALRVSGQDASAKQSARPPKPQNAVSPDGALELLRKGNARYVEGLSQRHDFKHERDSLVSGQNPYAGILSCADSRVAPEYAFDSGRGDLFVCRVAGNFANADIVRQLRIRGRKSGDPAHRGARARRLWRRERHVTITQGRGGRFPVICPRWSQIWPRPAQAGSAQPGDPLGNAIRQNVVDTVAKLASATPILSAAVEHHRVRIVGGIYRLASGLVEMVA